MKIEPLTRYHGETIHTFIKRLIDNHLQHGVTDMLDISAHIRKQYTFSSGQVSSAKKSLLEDFHAKLKVLGPITPNGEKL